MAVALGHVPDPEGTISCRPLIVQTFPRAIVACEVAPVSAGTMAQLSQASAAGRGRTVHALSKCMSWMVHASIWWSTI